jgi:hypothetical protein
MIVRSGTEVKRDFALGPILAIMSLIGRRSSGSRPIMRAEVLVAVGAS